jgi:hypothetical protein
MYYIYHIPGVKIGCSQNIKNRIKQQKFSLKQLKDRTIFIDKEYQVIGDSVDIP